ncbi:MAG: diguanylate cyclase [Clostridiaceae bacterium]|jgi:diguanylate cyclase (GGDEF)-like protein|nr:diguanylate cyclase [Clostridiaceae bacterium]
MPGKKKSYTFGILIDWITSWGESHYYQSLLLSGLSDFAKENNINVICFVTGRVDSPYEWDRCRNILLKFIDKNKVDGLVVPTTAIGVYSDSNSIVKLLEGYDLPIITVGERFENFPSVTIDNYTGMRQVVDHLIEEHGYRRIAIIKGPPCKEAFIRFQAYCDSLAAHQIEFDPSLIYNGDFRFDSGSEAVRTFRRENIRFDALVSSNDNMAMGALLEFNKNNKNLVFTLPITGFDDTENGRVYGLTTVRQNFYDQTRKAGEMLLNILEGRDIPLHVEIPSRMILRSSCGCVPSVVKKAYVVPDLKKDSINVQEQIDQIMAVLEQINDTLDISDSLIVQKSLLGQERKILESFFEEYLNGSKDKFVMSIHRFILWCSENKIDWLFIQDILPAIRKTVMNSLATREEVIRAENLLHAATIFIFDTFQNAASNRSISNPLLGENTERLGEALLASLDYESQLKTACQLLPLLDIHACYIALFEDEDNPLDKSRLILAMTDKTCYQKGGRGMVFNTLDLLPEPFLEELYKDRFSLVVQVLHQGNNKMGYVILDYDATINKNYEIIRYGLSVSLKGTMLIERITKQAADLEIQVRERTKELSESNKNLKEEIAKRKEVERQLKQALRDLSYYNEQLHLQSIRDELTQLYNRRGFMKLGNEYFETARKNSTTFLLLFADMDGLKRINDQFGHSEGDYAIASTAQILNKAFRNTDIIGRLGGDEFTVIISGASRKDEDDIRNRIQRYCDLHNELSKKPYQLSISLGFAYYNPESSDSFEDLMKEADKALYEDKQAKLKKSGE